VASMDCIPPSVSTQNPPDFNTECDGGIRVDCAAFNLRNAPSGQQNGSPAGVNSVPVSNPGNVFQVVPELVFKGVDPGTDFFVTANGVNYNLNRIATTGVLGNTYVVRGIIPGNPSSIQLNDPRTDLAESVKLYIYRNADPDGDATGFFTEVNGFNNVVCLEFMVPKRTSAKDITLTIPFSEITNDGRTLTVTAYSGANAGDCSVIPSGRVTDTETINGPDGSLPPSNANCCAHVVELTLTDVPADVMRVSLQIDTRGGQQSWVLGAAVEVVTTCPVLCNPNFDPGEINGGLVVCGDYIPDTNFPTNRSTPASNCDGFITYQWEYTSTFNENDFNEISGATDEILTAQQLSNAFGGVITETIWLRRRAFCEGCVDSEVTNFIDLHINRNFEDPGVIGDDQCICSGNRPARINSLEDPSGQVQSTRSSLEVIWQARTIGGPWVNVLEFVSDEQDDPDAPFSFRPGSITETMQYRRGVRIRPCDDFRYSNIITVQVDTEDPTFNENLPQDMSVECDAIPNAPTLTASDNCDDNVDVTFSEESTQGNNNTCEGGRYQITRTWVARDDCGNRTTHTQIITVDDTTAPEQTGNCNIDDITTVECQGFEANRQEARDWRDGIINALSNCFSDNCSDVVVTSDFNFNNLSDECGLTGSLTVTFTIADRCGNAVHEEATFTIVDNTPPNIGTEASPETVECDGSGNNSALMAWLNDNGGAEASDACGSVRWENDFDALSDDCGATGTVVVTFTAIDECDNTSTTSARFTIEDTTAPDIGTEASPETVECDGNGNNAALQAWLMDNGGARASDICGGVRWENDFSDLSNECGETGSVTVVFTAIDDCDNESTTTAIFTIEDTRAPEVNCDPISVSDFECSGADANEAEADQWNADNIAALIACSSDECSGNNFTVTSDYDFNSLSDECGTTGSLTAIYTITDDCDNSVTREATFTIVDTTDPTSCDAENELHQCNGLAGNEEAAVAWNQANLDLLRECAADDCSEVEVMSDYDFDNLQGDCGFTGVLPVTYTITDDCGRSITRSATFTIEDTTAPTITTPAQTDRTVECDGAGNVQEFEDWLAANGNLAAEDECGSVSVSNEIVSDEELCCATRVVTVLFTVTDECDNESESTGVFTIEDTTPPDVVCQDITIQLDENGEASIVATDLDGGSSDVCCADELEFEISQTNFTRDDVGVVQVTLTVTDACGNSDQCVAEVTVEEFDLALRKVLAAGEDENYIYHRGV